RLALPSQPMEPNVNLTLSLGADSGRVWRDLDSGVRNQIRKAERSGLSVEVGRGEKLAPFYEIFAERMRDLGSPVHAPRCFRSPRSDRSGTEGRHAGGRPGCARLQRPSRGALGLVSEGVPVVVPQYAPVLGSPPNGMRGGVPDLRFRPVEPPFGYVSLQTSVGRARRAAVLVHDPHHPTARSAGGEPPHGGSAREGVATSAIGSDPRPWPPHSQVPHAVMARRPIMLARIGSSQIKRTRWFAAQEYEQAFWQRRATSIEDGTAGQLDWYDWKACRLEEHLAS